MRVFSISYGLIFLLIIINATGNRCHRNVDAFMKRIFKGVKLSLDQSDIVALTDIKRGPCISTRTIYFSAYITNAIRGSSLSQYQPIKFTDEVTNEGGGYNASTGEFTAPITGAYSFSWEFLVDPGGYVVLQLQKNKNLFAHNYAYGSKSHHGIGSKSTIMNLVKGDKVRVVFYGGNGKLFAAYRYTGFSGFTM